MSEYNMSHTGEQLDDAIQAVLDRTVTLDGTTLKVNEQNKQIYVDVADTVEEGNDLPVSSNAVATAIEGLDKITFDDSFTVTTSEDNKTKNVSVKTTDSIDEENLLPPTSQAVASALKDLNMDSRFVIEPVYPLSVAASRIGVVVETTGAFKYVKIVDNEYSKEDIAGQYLHNVGTGAKVKIALSDLIDISENGSFMHFNTSFVVVNQKDVDKDLEVVDRGLASFPEPGTYIWDPGLSTFVWRLDIAGTYKREVEVHDFDVIVEGEIDLETFNVVSLNKSYGEIAEALRLKKDVRLILNVPLGEDKSISVLGNVETSSLGDGLIQFGVITDIATELSDNNEQVHHFRITLYQNDSVETDIKLLSGDGSGSGNVISPIVEITEIDNGHRVSIGTESFDVLNGDDGRSIHYYANSVVHGTDTFAIPYFESNFPYSTFETINSNDLCINRIGEIGVVVRTIVADSEASAVKLIELKRLYQIKGDPFTYEDFTPEQLEALKGKAFTYEDFTPEQLEALKVKGDKPQVYVDYFTDKDKAEMVTAVINALPTAEGVEF